MAKFSKPIKTTLPTTTLAISGLGARAEDVEKARASGMQLNPFVKRLNLLIYGPPGTAKTVNAHHLPGTRTLDLDDGMLSVEWAIKEGLIKKDPSEIVYKTILQPHNDPKSTFVLDEAADTVDQWLAEEDIPPEEWDRPYPQKWDTLIIDSGSALTDASIIKALKENDRLQISKSLKRWQGDLTPMMIQDWGSASSLFQKFINNCRTIGKNLVLICHEYEATDESGNTIAYEPLLIGQLRQKIPKDFDEVWYAHTSGSRQNPKFQFQTTPDPKHHLRSRVGCLDAVEDANFSLIRSKIAKFYGVDEEKIWKAEHGTEGAERAAAEASSFAGKI